MLWIGRWLVYNLLIDIVQTQPGENEVETDVSTERLHIFGLYPHNGKVYVPLAKEDFPTIQWYNADTFTLAGTLVVKDKAGNSSRFNAWEDILEYYGYAEEDPECYRQVVGGPSISLMTPIANNHFLVCDASRRVGSECDRTQFFTYSFPVNRDSLFPVLQNCYFYDVSGADGTPVLKTQLYVPQIEQMTTSNGLIKTFSANALLRHDGDNNYVAYFHDTSGTVWRLAFNSTTDAEVDAIKVIETLSPQAVLYPPPAPPYRYNSFIRHIALSNNDVFVYFKNGLDGTIRYTKITSASTALQCKCANNWQTLATPCPAAGAISCGVADWLPDVDAWNPDAIFNSLGSDKTQNGTTLLLFAKSGKNLITELDADYASPSDEVVDEWNVELFGGNAWRDVTSADIGTKRSLVFVGAGNKYARYMYDRTEGAGLSELFRYQETTVYGNDNDMKVIVRASPSYAFATQLFEYTPTNPEPEPKHLVRIPFENCAQYTTCRACRAAHDPYCGWCSYNAQCTRNSACGNTAIDELWLTNNSVVECPALFGVSPKFINPGVATDFVIATNIFNVVGNGSYLCDFYVDGSVMTSFTRTGAWTMGSLRCSVNSGDIILNSNAVAVMKIDVRHSSSPEGISILENLGPFSVTVYDCQSPLAGSSGVTCDTCLSIPADPGCGWCRFLGSCTASINCPSAAAGTHTNWVNSTGACPALEVTSGDIPASVATPVNFKLVNIALVNQSDVVGGPYLVDQARCKWSTRPGPRSLGTSATVTAPVELLTGRKRIGAVFDDMRYSCLFPRDFAVVGQLNGAFGFEEQQDMAIEFTRDNGTTWLVLVTAPQAVTVFDCSRHVTCDACMNARSDAGYECEWNGVLSECAHVGKYTGDEGAFDITSGDPTDCPRYGSNSPQNGLTIGGSGSQDTIAIQDTDTQILIQGVSFFRSINHVLPDKGYRCRWYGLSFTYLETTGMYVSNRTLECPLPSVEVVSVQTAVIYIYIADIKLPWYDTRVPEGITVTVVNCTSDIDGCPGCHCRVASTGICGYCGDRSTGTIGYCSTAAECPGDTPWEVSGCITSFTPCTYDSSIGGSLWWGWALVAGGVAGGVVVLGLGVSRIVKARKLGTAYPNRKGKDKSRTL